MAYWNHYVYVLSNGDALRQFEVNDAQALAQSGQWLPWGVRDPNCIRERTKRWDRLDTALQILARTRPTRGSLRLRCRKRHP
jgi:hypothetical protein